MRNYSTLLIAAALAYLGFILFGEASAANSAEVVDQTKVVTLFISLVLVGLAVGVLLVLTFLPSFGDWVGGMFFNPGEQIEKSPHAGALAAIACGDYPKAIAEYRKCIEADPNDTHAISEIVHIYCDKLDDPEHAEEILEEALARDWAHDDAAFLTQRLAEVYWSHQHDARRARTLLLTVIENFPNTKHSANAQHKLQEIERQLASED